ncbi:hypothetical protein ERO13_D05G256850v2 [Gossypium hirsutum]|uniref:Uncharacterized protein n=1 Tax=Gossypium mustelinum TaxID=34275 RepID=A0A5D2V1R5_GOSMU|nr:hypothetical protein ERO13_D05G256850v2 [Gossypium hirsutum]TYI83180.1 hypothetical protein E1A91_D05G273800v1 [Gossypium mustelinum]
MGGLAKGFLQSSLAFCPPRTIIEQVLPFLLWSFMEGFDCSSCVPTPEVKGVEVSRVLSASFVCMYPSQ